MINSKIRFKLDFFSGTLATIAKMSETRENFMLGMTLDFVTGFILLVAGVHLTNNHFATAFLVMLFGLLVFSLIEYCFHRWLFHSPVPLMEPGHRKHHESPLGYDSLPFFLPPVTLLVMTFMCTFFTSKNYALLFIGSLAFGYAMYGLCHRIIHIRRFRHPLLRRWAARHFIHHHHTDVNFGVTTPLWDYILGTRYVPKHKVAILET